MELKDLILKNRSCRRFYEDAAIGAEGLKPLVDLARLTPSSANLQPLRYVLSFEAAKNSLIFPHLRWAGYLKGWGGPIEGERPSAYIVVLLDTEVSRAVVCDQGIAAQTILLGAVERGLAGCIIASIDKAGLRQSLAVPARYEILLVIAIGRPKEKAVLEPFAGDVKYWRDAEGVHHVPKRRLEDIILDL